VTSLGPFTPFGRILRFRGASFFEKCAFAFLGTIPKSIRRILVSLYKTIEFKISQFSLSRVIFFSQAKSLILNKKLEMLETLSSKQKRK